MTINRRDLLAASAGLVATTGLGKFGMTSAFAQAAEPKYTPEQGASLRLLRWTPFVKGDAEIDARDCRSRIELQGASESVCGLFMFVLFEQSNADVIGAISFLAGGRCRRGVLTSSGALVY